MIAGRFPWIQSYVFDEVRAQVPKMRLDDVFQNKDDIAIAVREGLEETMNQFGFAILKSLVSDIDPAPNVKQAMNEINAAQRHRRAAEERCGGRSANLGSMDGPVEETRLLDRYLPEWDASRVDSLWVPATPERALRAVEELSVEELPLFRWLMKARLAPARALGRHYPIELSGGFLDGFLGIGFVPLGRRPGREVAIGGVGRFWRPIRFFPLAPLADARAFDAFDEPGWTRAAFDVTVQPEGDGARITSEIRMAGTDPVSARRFRRYWRLIRVPSGWIRRSALRCVRRRLQVSG